MHKRFVINIIARILLIVCGCMLAPLGWAIHDDLHSLETQSFFVTILLGTLLSSFCLWQFKIKKIDYSKINAKDGLAIVSLSWICLSLVGALPFYLSGALPSYTDSFFEIASGFSTTGASVVIDIEALPRGVLFWRSMSHWLGGMGIIVLYLALLPALGQNAYQLYKAEAPGIKAERLQPHIKETAKVLWSVYFLLTIAQTALLMIGGMPIFDALCHTFGTIATGGFSTKNLSIAYYSPYIQWVIILFMFLAGINFMLHFQILRGRFLMPFRREEFRYYLALIVVLVPVFAFVLYKTQLSASPFRDSIFQILAMLTTTGYVTADFDLWPNALKFTMVLLMFIGGCGGSTAGGMKVVRIFLSIKIALRSGLQAIFPNAVLPIKFNGEPLSNRLILSVLSYFVIFMFLFFIGTVLIVITESCDLVTAYTSSIAALSNIGPGLAAVGPTHNYAWFSIPGKWILTFLMLAGRLELYCILILFLPSTWRK